MKKIVIGLVGILMVAVGAMAQEPITALERVGTRASEGGAQFMLKESGTPFFAKGFNYIRLRAAEGRTGGDHATFDADTQNTKAHYDPNRAEAMFSALSKAGYNTVRVFVIGRSKTNPGIAGDYDTTKTLYEPYMENVLDFLRRATQHRIRVFPTFGDGGVPLNAYYRERVRGKGHNKNVFVLTEEGIAARVEYISAFLSYIKDRAPTLLPTLLGLQCQNEAYLRADQWPFTEKQGAFTAANGKTYDLSRTDQRQALMDEGYQYYHQRIVAAVKVVDAEMLVSEGLFVLRAVGKDAKQHAGLWPGKTRDERYPPMLTTLGRGTLDFLDVHFYRTNKKESVDQAFRLNLASTGFFAPEMTEIRKQKPVIMGEFGAFDHVEKTFDQAVDNMVRVCDLALAEGVNGMLFWTYDCFEQARLYHAASDWGLFVRKMGNDDLSRCLVGVHYFAGWWKPLPNKYIHRGTDWRQDYPGRVPLLGLYNDQPTMDKEIVTAARFGVDFFQILWYPVDDMRRRCADEQREPPPHAEKLNEGLRLFLRSPENHRIRFTIEYVNHAPFAIVDDASWENTCRTWCAAMRHPSYLKVGGRPVFKVHGLHAFRLQNPDAPTQVGHRIRTLRNIAQQAGLPNPLIGAGASPLGVPLPEALAPFDFVTTYMEVPRLEQQAELYPYEKLLDVAEKGWKDYATHCSKPYIPYLPAGWDPRPWKDPRPSFQLPNHRQWQAALNSVKLTLEQHETLGLPTPQGRQKLFLIYAWNEFAEGGIIAPTHGDGTMKLQTIKEVFGIRTAGEVTAE
jgi:hypothetical protein